MNAIKGRSCQELEMQGLWTIKRAAEYLGVTPGTLRRWDRLGKFKAARHPVNRYRIYKAREVAEFKYKISKGI